MKTKIFISWSGSLGNSIAQKLRDFLSIALPNCEPFFSSRDIKGGEIGIQRLVDELRTTRYGIILLTPDAVQSSWVAFETGCLFKGFSNVVFPLRCGIQQSDLTSHPAGQIQCQDFAKKSLRELVSQINGENLFDKYRPEQLELWFDTAWEKVGLDLVLGDLERESERLVAQNEAVNEIASGFIGQGELATMNVKDLVEILEGILQKKNEEDSTIDGGTF